MRNLLLLLVAALSLTQETTIEGVVRETGTEQPIAGAVVTLPLPAGRPLTVTSDAEGKFAFAAVPAGRYRVYADKVGYARSKPDGRMLPGNFGVWLEVVAGQPVKDLVMHLSPGAAITGRVFDGAGAPLQRTRPTISRYVFDDNGEKQLRGVPTGNLPGTTNDKGEFRVFGLDPGEYYVAFDPPLLAAAAGGKAYQASWYPGVTDVTKAEPITVKAGEEFRLNDVTIPSTEAASVTLHVVNETGSPLAPIRYLQLRDKAKPKAPISLVGGAQGFGGPNNIEFAAVAAGNYEVGGGFQDGTGMHFSRVSIQVGTGPYEGTLVLRKGVKLTGRVVSPQANGSKKPVAGARVTFTSEGLFQQIRPVSAADGTFSVEPFPPGDHRFSIAGLPPDGYALPSTAGTVAVSGDASIELAVGLDGATLEGTVTNAKGGKVGDAVVALVPEDAKALILYRNTNSDQRGAFSLRGIAPGSYRLFAWSELEGAADKNAEFMKKYEKAGTAVKLGPLAKSNVMIKVEP